MDPWKDGGDEEAFRRESGGVVKEWEDGGLTLSPLTEPAQFSDSLDWLAQAHAPKQKMSAYLSKDTGVRDCVRPS